MFRHVPAGAPRHLWPYALFGYALLAAFVPWSIAVTGGLVLDDDLTLRLSVGLAICTALPAYLATRWLAATPYHLIGLGCWLLVAGWGVHALATVVHLARRRAP